LQVSDNRIVARSTKAFILNYCIARVEKRYDFD